MTIRNVDQWVSQAMTAIERFRPNLPSEKRDVQRAILAKLGTNGISYTADDASEETVRRGKIHEELTMLDPSYPQTTGLAGQVRDYLLAYLRNYSFEDVLDPPHSFSNPDDLIIEVVGNMATIVGIVEIKHTAPNKDMKRQVRYIVEDIDIIVGLMSRHLRNVERTVGKKPSFRKINGLSWPKEIKKLVLKTDYQRVLYLSADRDAFVEGWTARDSSFTSNEIKSIVKIGWDELVAKGGATPATEEEPGMAIHRAATSGSERPEDAVDVPSARPREEPDVTTAQQSRTSNTCEGCGQRPFLYGPNRNGLVVPIADRVYDEVKGVWIFVKKCTICKGKSNAALAEQMRQRSHETIAITLREFPGKVNAEFLKEQIDRKIAEIIAGPGTDPEMLNVAEDEFKKVLRHTQLLCGYYWIEAGLAEIEGKPEGKRVALVRNRLEGTEARRALLLAGGNHTSFVADPGNEDPTGLDLVRNEGDVYHFAKVFCAQAQTAAEQATTEGEKEAAKAELEELYAAAQSGSKDAVDEPEGEEASDAVAGEPDELETPSPTAVSERKCRACMTIAKTGEGTCSACGAALPAEEDVPAAAPAPVATQQPAVPQAKLDEVAAVVAASETPTTQPASTSAPAAPAPAPTSSPAAQDTKFCGECGVRHPVANKFCTDCGAVQKAAES